MPEVRRIQIFGGSDLDYADDGITLTGVLKEKNRRLQTGMLKCIERYKGVCVCIRWGIIVMARAPSY